MAVTLPSSFAAHQPTGETSGHQGVDAHLGTRQIRTRSQERRRAEEEIRRLNVCLLERVGERTARWKAANKEREAITYSVPGAESMVRAWERFGGALVWQPVATTARGHAQKEVRWRNPRVFKSAQTTEAGSVRLRKTVAPRGRPSRESRPKLTTWERGTAHALSGGMPLARTCI